MQGIDAESIITKALNSRTSDIFKYEWSFEDAKKKGELKFFFLRIKNMSELIANGTRDLNIDLVFGARKFTVTHRKLPAAGSQAFLEDSQKAIVEACANKKEYVVFPAKEEY